MVNTVGEAIGWPPFGDLGFTLSTTSRPLVSSQLALYRCCDVLSREVGWSRPA